ALRTGPAGRPLRAAQAERGRRLLHRSRRTRLTGLWRGRGAALEVRSLFFAARADHLAHDLPRRRNGNGKTDAHRAARIRIDGGVDPYQLTVRIDQRAARIARVDGRVGLDEILERMGA